LGRRPLIPPPGNAARPVFFLVACFFGLMLVGYPIFMYAMGLGITAIIWITLCIAGVAVGVMWYTVRLGQNLAEDARQLDAGDVWAEWLVPDDQHRRFVASLRRGTNRRALLTAMGGVGLGAGYAVLGDDWLGAVIMVVVFALAALVTWFFAGPPRDVHTEKSRRVRIGPDGVHSLGRYLPFRTTLIRLRDIEVVDGVSPELRFTVSSDRRRDVLRVPVPASQLPQIDDPVHRLRRMHDM
jgi:hypothetical protein